MKWKSLFLSFFFAYAVQSFSQQEPPIPVTPKHYVCYKASAPLKIDGKMDEKDWANVPWTDYFLDIEGSLKPSPRFQTRAKMLWDDTCFYFAFELEEPHVWATLTQRESVIFYDNDIEIFIDPDGDTHHYYEYEMNAFNTQWDLLLRKPYRDDTQQNVAIDNWSINDIKSAVTVLGTINNPKDTDKGWIIEVAMPWDCLEECAKHSGPPLNGEQWRVNFSRVEWQMDVVNGKYQKRTHLVDGKQKPLPEDNWVWSPQGVVNMHQPETWGFVQFSDKKAGTGTDSYFPDPDNDIQWALRMLYYREKVYFDNNKHYTENLKALSLDTYKISQKDFLPHIYFTPSFYEATHLSHDGKRVWHITQDGRIWKTDL